jgi:hypothetical protein
MSTKDLRPNATVRGGQLATSGSMTVTFVGVRKRTSRATVMGPGTTSGLKLRVHDTNPSRTVDNVPKQTTLNQINCYVYRD